MLAIFPERHYKRRYESNLSHCPISGLGQQQYPIKIAFSAATSMFLAVLQFAISIDQESVFSLSYIELLPIKAVDNSIICVKIHAMPSLPTIQQLTLWLLRRHSFSECSWELFAGVLCLKAASSS